MATIAIITMTGCSVMNMNMATTDNQTEGSGNVAEELVALINDYTQKINAVESVYVITERVHIYLPSAQVGTVADQEPPD